MEVVQSLRIPVLSMVDIFGSSAILILVVITMESPRPVLRITPTVKLMGGVNASIITTKVVPLKLKVATVAKNSKTKVSSTCTMTISSSRVLLRSNATIRCTSSGIQAYSSYLKLCQSIAIHPRGKWNTPEAITRSMGRAVHHAVYVLFNKAPCQV